MIIHRKTWTYSGEGTQDEMCVTLLFFYPMEALNAVSCGNLGDLDYCVANYPGEMETNGCSLTDITWYGEGGKGWENLEKLRANCKSDIQCTPECEEVVEEIRSGPCFKNGVFDVFQRIMPPDPARYELLARMSACRQKEQKCTMDDVMRHGLDDLFGEDVRDGGMNLVSSYLMIVVLACFATYQFMF